jgi:ABC-type proline/glycine betaine transport system permease subunit
MSIFKNDPESVFVLGTQKACEKAIKYGWIAATVSAVLTLIMAVLGFFIHSENAALQYALDPMLLIDAVLIAVLAFFIFKKSRTAATILLIYFILSKIMVWMDTHSLSGGGIALIFILIYFNAMRATYIWHSKYKNVRPQEATIPVNTDENK